MLWVNFETLFLRPWERFSDQPFLLEVSLGHCMVIVDGPNNMPWRGQLFNEAPMELSSKAAVFSSKNSLGVNILESQNLETQNLVNIWKSKKPFVC